MAATRGNIAPHGENLFVRFANSDGFCATEDRIRGLIPHNGQNSDQLPVQEVLRGHVGRKKELDNLIAAFGHRLHEEHPNPERTGCPGRAALTRLASEPGSIDASSILDHIRQCAPCLDELRNLRTAKKRQPQ